MIKRLLLSGAIALALGGVAHAQANNSSTWQTPGNQTVGGAVQLCPRASDGVAIPCNSAGGGAAAGTAGYPAGATPLMASSTGTTGAFSVTLAAAAAKTNYLCGFSVQVTASAATNGSGSSVTGLLGGNLNFMAPAGTSPAVVDKTETFSPCLPASAVNTAIAVNIAAPGAGGVATAAAWGYQL